AAYHGVTMDAAAGFSWLAVIGGLIVARNKLREWYAAFQACGFAAAALWAFYGIDGTGWIPDETAGYPRSLDPRTWQAIGTAWAVLCIGWLSLRRAVDRAKAKTAATPA